MGICAHLGDSAVSTAREEGGARGDQDRKSTRLNSSHSQISYAVFCLKKKKQTPHKLFISVNEHDEAASTIIADRFSTDKQTSAVIIPVLVDTISQEHYTNLACLTCH